jgi:hypothetical protein
MDNASWPPRTPRLFAGLTGMGLLLATVALPSSTASLPDLTTAGGSVGVRTGGPLSHGRLLRWRDAKGEPEPGPHDETISSNWSGYSVRGGHFTSVRGTWTVPRVSYQSYPDSPDYEASSTWIGIGGEDGDESLIQVGTMQAAGPNGETEYFAWFETLPSAEAAISSKQYPIQPGDVITASIKCIENCKPNVQATWEVTLSNPGRWSHPYSIQTLYTSSLGSAEWIMEGPCLERCSDSEPGYAYLPNFGSTTFTAITVNESSPNLARSSHGIIMRDPKGKATSKPSGPLGDDSFTVIFGI